MSETDEEAIVRHVRGAIIMHQSPFSSLEVPCVENAFSEQEYEKWVVPFYRVSFCEVDTEFWQALGNVYHDITPSVVAQLLTDYDWRSRLTGAFFAGLKEFTSLENRIGRLLLRSDLCFAGKIYSVALAEFNTSVSLSYLTKYLEYYLTRPDLDYDQGEAIGAIAWLDALNGTRNFENFLPLWQSYEAQKSWKPNLERKVTQFADEMRALHGCRAKAVGGI